MASLPHSPVTFSGVSASDLLQSSSNGLNGIPLRLLGKVRLDAGRSDFTITSKIKKWKKHDRPWPEEIDPNVKGGHVSYLSSFKPLKEKPKPVTLDFEKPLRILEKKIMDVRKMADETGLDFSDQIVSLETKYQQGQVLHESGAVNEQEVYMESNGIQVNFYPVTQLVTGQVDSAESLLGWRTVIALKDLYTHVTPIQRLNIARHPNRPTFLDHVLKITDKFVELHGDRAGYDDPAIVTGIGSIEGRNYMFIGHQKGRNTKENIQRNFGMPTPHGYRKALRMMYYADHHGLPIITFIDTPGAYADLKSEELGQGEAIAHNLRSMYGLKVPIVTVVIGEGGSGGALAIGCANKLLMLENAVFFVASPEACAAILWKTSKASPKAAEKLKITATELCKLKIADGIIPEPLGGAHTDPSWTSQQIKIAVLEAMNELLQMDTPKLLEHRMLKFRAIGGFQEGLPVSPEKKAKMKKKEEPIIQKVELGTTTDIDLEDEIEKLRQKIRDAKDSPSTEPLKLDMHGMIKKLKKEIDQEYSKAVKSMGLCHQLEIIRKEVAEARNSQDQIIDPGLKEKIDKIRQEFNLGLSKAPNFTNLSYKLDMLKEISKAKGLLEQNNKLALLKQEINKGIKEVVDRSDIREKIEALKAEIADASGSVEGDLDEGMRDKILKLKNEIGSDIANVLKSLDLDVVGVLPSDMKIKINELNDEINEEIENVIDSSDLKYKLETLKLEVAKAGRSPDQESKNKIEVLKQQIKQNLVEAMNSSPLIEKYEKLSQEAARAKKSEEFEGSLNQETLKEEDDAKHEKLRLES